MMVELWPLDQDRLEAHPEGGSREKGEEQRALCILC